MTREEMKNLPFNQLSAWAHSMETALQSVRTMLAISQANEPRTDWQHLIDYIDESLTLPQEQGPAE